MIPSRRSLEKRVERVERMLADVHAQLGLPQAGAEPRSGEGAEAPEGPDRWAHEGEQWMGRVGIGLLFLGLVYLFNYSIEQGWITPAVRVAAGLAIGGALLALGLRLEAGRPSYSRILLAGALAVFYVTGFAAFQLYALVSHAGAFAYMSAVTLLGLWLARRQDHPSLAIVGALGGFATPFLLRSGAEPVVELTVYASLVIGWTAVLYALRGWRTLVWTYLAGGLAVLAVAASSAVGGERWVVQGGLALAWLLGDALPFAREAARPGAHAGERRWRLPLTLELRALGVGATTTVLLLTDRMWELADPVSGALFLAAAALHAAIGRFAEARPNAVGRTSLAVAAALCAEGTFLLLDDPLVVAALAAEAYLFVRLARQRRWSGLRWVGHAVFAYLALDFVEGAIRGPRVAFDPLALFQLLGIALALAASLHLWRRSTAWTYRVVCHLLLLAWLAVEIEPLPVGTGMVTVAWGSYGAALLVLALRPREGRRDPGLQLVAYSALALTVLKLLTLDLARVDVVWRILLFLGLGAAFLGLSFLFKRGEGMEGREGTEAA